MAVTQQLAKLCEEKLKECVSSEPVIEELIGFSLLQKKDYLDLNWEGTFIVKLLNQNNNEQKKILAEALDGLHPVSYKELDVYEQPRYLLRDEVMLVDEAIGKTDFNKVLRTLPDTLEEINSFLKSEYKVKPEEILLSAWNEFASFYKNAALNRSCVICWWD